MSVWYDRFGKGYITRMGAVVVDRKVFDEIVKGKEA